MQDVTYLMNRYRECVRHLWNVYFLQQGNELETATWDSRDEFARIAQSLFSSLVLGPVGREEYKKSLEYDSIKEPLSFLLVIPMSGTSVPIQINREKTPSGYWDHPVDRVSRGDADLRFIDFYDFDLLGFRDFEYYLVRIQDAKDRDLTGRHALIKCGYSTVILQDP